MYASCGVWYEEAEIRACYYCGDAATSVDHFISQVLAARLTLGGKQMLIPACRECNSILGPRFFRTLELRREAAKDGIRKKYRRVLALPDWSEDECLALGPTLQSKIRGNQKLKRIVQERLAYRGALTAVVIFDLPEIGSATAVVDAESLPISSDFSKESEQK